MLVRLASRLGDGDAVDAEPEAHVWGLRGLTLVVIGSRDDRMALGKNLELFETLREDNPHIELRSIAEADHGLRAGSELQPGVAESIAAWIGGARKR